jgi:nucleoside-diphosphate-sugar epimerase
VNVTGTAYVVKACKEMNVPHLIYTSSLDAIFGGQPLLDIDESIPYPEKHPNSYCRSKAEGEKIVLGNGSDGLSTCVLRPADIYGEGDPFHIGSLIGMAKKGFYVKLGDGKTRSQHVYVGNIAWAHILAAAAMLGGNESINRNVYFITDGPPSNFFTFFDRFVEGSGYKIRPRNFRIPRQTAFFLGSVSELMARLLRPVKKYTPKMSRFAVIYTCTDFTFTSEKAGKDFGYAPKYDSEEAYEKTVAFFKKPS